MIEFVYGVLHLAVPLAVTLWLVTLTVLVVNGVLWHYDYGDTHHLAVNRDL